MLHLQNAKELLQQALLGIILLVVWMTLAEPLRSKINLLDAQQTAVHHRGLFCMAVLHLLVFKACDLYATLKKHGCLQIEDPSLAILTFEGGFGIPENTTTCQILHLPPDNLLEWATTSDFSAHQHTHTSPTQRWKTPKWRSMLL